MIRMSLLAAAPSIALLIFIYQKDRYDREPKLLLLKLFISGFFITIPVFFVEKFLDSFMPANIIFKAFIVAGFTEEFFKLFLVKKIAFNNKSYDEKLDGIIYSVFVSLGFATAENFLYVFSNRLNFIYTGITRAIFAVPAHMLFAVTMGYYLSLSKFSTNRFSSKVYMIEALIVPLILHGTYDYILSVEKYNVIPIFILFVIYLWRLNLKRINRYVSDSKDRMSK